MYEFCFQGRERKCWTAWSPGYPGRTGELPQVLTHEIIKTLGWETLQDRRTKLRLTTRFYSNKTFKVPLIFIQPGFNMSIWTLFLQSHHFKGYYHHSPKTILKWNQFHHYIITSLCALQQDIQDGIDTLKLETFISIAHQILNCCAP